MINEITNDRPDTLSIQWEMSSTCNFECWYCPTRYHDGKYRWPNFDDALDFFTDVAEQNKHRPIWVNILGGEPTLWPELPKFLSMLPPNIEHTVTTNGSRTIKWWKNNYKSFINVGISHHPLQGDSNHVYNVVEFLSQQENINIVYVSIMVVKEKLDECIEIIEKFENSDIKMSLIVKHISPWGDIDRDKVKQNNTVDVIKLMDRSFRRRKDTFKTAQPTTCYYNSEEINFRKLELDSEDNFEGWKCTIGVNRLYIKPNGDVFRAVCCIKSGRSKIGNITYSSNFTNLKPITCVTDACGCRDELILHKWQE
jgi:organic radical activating enzyme